jgi:hypothetical protein
VSIRARSLIAAAFIATVLVAVTPACSAAEALPPDPLLVLEIPADKSDAVDLVVVDLGARELLRQSTGSTEPLPTLHAASAQVAFWRGDASGTRHELVVWNIATKALKVVATYANRPATGPLWSVDGTEIVTLTTTTSISYMPGAIFDGKAEVSVTTVATAQSRIVATDRAFMPAFANSQIVAGQSFSGDTKHIVVDAHTGQAIREVALTGAVLVLPTADPDVLIAMREIGAPGEVTRQVLNVRTGAELAQLGQDFATPMPSWPGRTEIVFVAGGDLKALDYVANSTRVVGRFEGAAAPLGFDALGKVLMAALAREPYVGTFAITDGRIASAVRPVPLTYLSHPLGLVRIKV